METLLDKKRNVVVRKELFAIQYGKRKLRLTMARVLPSKWVMPTKITLA